MKLRLRVLGVLIFGNLLCSLVAFAAIEVPEQFQSNNAAAILGLDKDPSLASPDSVLTQDMITRAYRKLIMKYHPDRYSDAQTLFL